jgi:hypothetical protein
MIPEPGACGEPWDVFEIGSSAGVSGRLFATHAGTAPEQDIAHSPMDWYGDGTLVQRAKECVNALDGCDPAALSGLIATARTVVAQAHLHPSYYLCRLAEALDAFTKREK